MSKPAPIKDYEQCRGESPVGTHVCAEREFCKRYMPAGGKVIYKDFWIADSCPKFESTSNFIPEEKAKLDW